ncbi:Na/Pi cotransporter family protein [Desulfovibrio inopinatus]|uniref:Na/Pi cotransporter family protein n=1 Tax=Desulfovibrio inopinatus TaxID=102109 RepID=UPI0004044ED2|nr:Na/Pi symporter [Desulfovibrio inopinatus]
MNFDMIITILGGVGLILLGMKLMTDGLKLAGGNVLRSLLKSWTKTPAWGLFSGFLVTAVVQSSGAITVAVIGFVNAGLMSLFRAIWVVYGSNVGTTTTAWIVASLGLKVDVDMFALPLIIVGTALWLTGKITRRAGLGEALAGFGLFFLGIQIMESTLHGLGTGLNFSVIVSQGMAGRAMYCLVGFVLTTMMQSSSASIALILTATAGGVVSLTTAAAAVIGANVGTTSTAAVAVLGATSNAKRVAAFHVSFNFLTGIVAFFILPLFMSVFSSATAFIGAHPAPTTILAIFHTFFNVLGVCLLTPFTRRLVHFFENRFRSHDEDESRARYLDANIMRTPALATDALVKEVGRLGELARRVCLTTLHCVAKPCSEMERNLDILRKLQHAIGRFAAHVSNEGMALETSTDLARILLAARYYNAAAEAAIDAERIEAALPPLPYDPLQDKLDLLREKARVILIEADAMHEGYAVSEIKYHYRSFDNRYKSLKQSFLEAGSGGRIRIDDMVGYLDFMSKVRRMLNQTVKGGNVLSRLRKQFEGTLSTQEWTE